MSRFDLNTEGCIEDGGIDRVAASPIYYFSVIWLGGNVSDGCHAKTLRLSRPSPNSKLKRTKSNANYQGQNSGCHYESAHPECITNKESMYEYCIKEYNFSIQV